VAITTFDKVLDELSASLAKESVDRTYAADSEEEAEWDGLFGVVWRFVWKWLLKGLGHAI